MKILSIRRRSYGISFTLKYLSKPNQNEKGIEILPEPACGGGRGASPPLENWGMSPLLWKN